MDWPRILVADAGEDLIEQLRAVMPHSGIEQLESDSEDHVESQLQARPPNLVIACSNGSDAGRSLKLIRHIRRSSKTIPVVFIAGQSSEQLAIAALRAGADDYFKLPLPDNSFASSLGRLMRDSPASSTLSAPSQDAQVMIGGSRSMQGGAA